MNNRSERSHGMLLLFTKLSRFISRWENFLQKKIRHSIPRSNNNLWSEIILSSSFHNKTRTSFINSAQTSSKVCSLDKPWTRGAVGREMDLWQMRKNWKKTLHQMSTSKDSKKKKWGIPNVGEQFMFPCANDSVTFAEDGPSRHTTKPSRPCSTRADPDITTRAQNLRLLECRWWTTTIWILGWVHEIHNFWINFHPTDIQVGRRKDLHLFKQHPGLTTFGRKYGRTCQKLPNARRTSETHVESAMRRCKAQKNSD